MEASPQHCIVCNQSVEQFYPYRGGWNGLPELMRLLYWTGSDVDNFLCPHCGCHDRERHLILYLVKLDLLKQFANADILHFAPENWFSKVIQLQEPNSYVRADLYPTQPDIEKVDLLQTGYADNSFDVVIANHVLEHVDDDLKALKEVRRILKPSGIAVLQTPFSLRLESTIEDKGVDDETTRLALYGQEDHVRLYGLDIFSRIESAGFASLVVTHEQALSEFDARHYGVNINEPLFLFQRVEA